MARIQRQGRLFAPLGMFKGSSERLNPDAWLQGNKDTTIAWHSTTDRALPAYDDPSNSPNLRAPNYYNEDDDNADEWGGQDDDVDDDGRPMAEYGSAVGMHFGTLRSAQERARSKAFKGQERREQFAHPVGIPNDTIKSQGIRTTQEYVGKDADGNHRWENVGEHIGYPDRVANYNGTMTDMVERGKTIAYKNEVEDEGSLSYRTLPQTVRTWGETVLEAAGQHDSFANKWGRSPGNMGLPQPSTAQVEAARRGYNPVVPITENRQAFDEAGVGPVQQTMFPVERWSPSKTGGGYTGHYTDDKDAMAQARSVPGDGSYLEGLGTGRSLRDPRSDEERRSMTNTVQFRKTGLRG